MVQATVLEENRENKELEALFEDFAPGNYPKKKRIVMAQ